MPSEIISVISTRSVGDPVKALGIVALKSLVSREEIDDRVGATPPSGT